MQLQKASLCRYSELALIYLPLSLMPNPEGFHDDVEMSDAVVAVAEIDETLEIDTDVSDFAEELLEAAE